MLSYTGSRALILGGTCRMAVDLADALVALQITPILTYRSRNGRERIAAAVNHPDASYALCPLDLAQPDTFAALDLHLDQGLDYLVDFAQGDLEGLAASVDIAAMRAYFDTNVAGRAEVLQRIVRGMLVRRFGRLVYVSSTAAARPNPGQGLYAASKQANEALYKNVGIELAARGITTVSLRPGYVDAGRGRDYLDRHDRKGLEKVPLGRALSSREVVDAIVFLLSDSAEGINAAAVTMDGGLAAAK